jgi:Na+-driven multidrug efflux pump
MVSIVLFGVQGTASHYFLAVHQPGKAGALLLGRQILAIPLFLVLPRFFGLTGLYLVSAVADLPLALLAAWYLRKEWTALGAAESGSREASSESVLAAESLEGA